MSAPEVDSSCWKDLPGAFLCHFLTIIPHKRAEVKAVCSTWRSAINSSLNEISLPAEDLPLLHQLPNIRLLVVTGRASESNMQQDARLSSYTWPPAPRSAAIAAPLAAEHAAAAAGCTSSPAPAGSSAASSNAGKISCWAAVDPWLLNRIQHLELRRCPDVVQHLAEGLWQPITSLSEAALDKCGSSRSSSWAAPLPAMTALKSLRLQSVGNVSPLLAAMNEHRAVGKKHQQSGTCSPPSVLTAAGPALEHLQELHLVDWSISCCYRGSTFCEQLQLLSTLPALHTLQLSGCGLMQEVPAPVLECKQLTRLLLCNNDLLTGLPAGISKLAALQVLDLSGNSRLCSLGPGFSKLASLTELNLSGPSRLWADCAAPPSSAEQGPGSSSAPAAESAGTAAASDGAGPNTLFPSAALSHEPLPHQQQHQLLLELASLQQLRRLTLSNNRQLMVLPGSITALTELTALDVKGCALRWLGEDLLDCVALQELLLGDNILADLPEGISRLQELRVLDIGRCNCLWGLPRSLWQLSKLTRIIVPSKAIGQHVLEQLECRQDAVEVEMDPADDAAYSSADWSEDRSPRTSDAFYDSACFESDDEYDWGPLDV